MTSTGKDDTPQLIYRQWHAMITTQNLPGLMELYAEDAVLESSAVLAIEKKEQGILREKAEIAPHFAAFFKLMGGPVSDWHRSPLFIDDQMLIWEYSSTGPHGDQLDVVESFDVRDGLIAYHRVYWGWRGFQLLERAH